MSCGEKGQNKSFSSSPVGRLTGLTEWTGQVNTDTRSTHGHREEKKQQPSEGKREREGRKKETRRETSRLAMVMRRRKTIHSKVNAVIARASKGDFYQFNWPCIESEK